MRCAEQFKISAGDGGILPSTADIGRGVRDQQVGSAAKQHIRSYGLFGPLEILKAFCVIAIWIDPTGSQCVHPFRSERSQPVHLFDIVDQCIFDLQLVSAVGRILQQTDQMTDRFFLHISRLIPSMRATVGDQRIQHGSRRFDRWCRQTVFWVLSQDADGAIGTDRQTVLALPAAVPSESFDGMMSGMMRRIRKKKGAGTYLYTSAAAAAFCAVDVQLCEVVHPAACCPLISWRTKSVAGLDRI